MKRIDVIFAAWLATITFGICLFMEFLPQNYGAKPETISVGSCVGKNGSVPTTHCYMSKGTSCTKGEDMSGGEGTSFVCYGYIVAGCNDTTSGGNIATEGDLYGYYTTTNCAATFLYQWCSYNPSTKKCYGDRVETSSCGSYPGPGGC